MIRDREKDKAIKKRTGEGPLENLKVRPWGVEPQSTEPESVILSIELRAHG